MNKKLLILLLIVALVLAWPFPAWTQGGIQVELGVVDSADFPTLRIPVAVKNFSNVPILDLQSGNFEVLEDGKPVVVEAITARQNSELNLSVALVLDLSGSAPLEDVKAAALEFLNQLGPKDRVAIIGFNDRLSFDTFDPTKEIPFTSDLDQARNLINGFTIRGWSAVYEAIYKGVLITAEEASARRAVIVMTDGYDNRSRPSIATADTPKTLAKERGIPIFTIGVYNPDPSVGRDPDYLNVLARETGGRYQEATPQKMGARFSEIVSQLRTEYVLTVQSHLEPDGKDHVLKVRAVTPQGTGERERLVSYPAPPPAPRILKLQRDVNGRLEDVAPESELRGKVLLVPQITAQNPLARVEYYVDERMAYLADVEARQGQGRHAPWEWEWNTRVVTEGLHTLAIIAYDNAGNSSERFSINVKVVRPSLIPGVETRWLLIGIAGLALLVLFILGLVFALRRRPQRCPNCGNILDPSWGGVCPYCAAATGPTTISAPAEPPTRPTPSLAPGAEPYPPTVPVAAPAPAGYPPVGFPEPVPPQVTVPMGEPMVPPTEAKTEVLARKPQAIGWLVVVQGPYPGREFRLQDGTTIGRSGDNDVILDDPSVSRQHAKVRLEGQTFILHDLGATNPTKVNGQEISKQPLSDGDRVEIGNVVLVFKQVQLP